MKQGKCNDFLLVVEVNMIPVVFLWRLYMHFGLRLWSSKPCARGTIPMVTLGSHRYPFVVDLPKLSVKGEGDGEARWVSMESWEAGGTMSWLWLPRQYSEVTQNWMWTHTSKKFLCMNSNSTSCSLSHRYMRKNEKFVMPMQSWVEDYWVLGARYCSSFVSWLSETQDGWSFVRDRLGAVLYAVATDLNSKTSIFKLLRFYVVYFCHYLGVITFWWLQWCTKMICILLELFGYTTCMISWKLISYIIVYK